MTTENDWLNSLSGSTSNVKYVLSSLASLAALQGKICQFR